MADEPIRATLLLVTGERFEFPVDMEPAREAVRRAVRRPDSPFNPGVLEKLDDREIVVECLARIYGVLAKSAEGMFYITDDQGGRWGLPARNVLAARVHDPSQTGKRPKRVGFTLEDSP